MKFWQLFMEGLSDLLHPYTFDIRFDTAKEGGLYYLDMSDVLAREIRGFEKGIPVIYHGDLKYHNPVTVSFYALLHHDRYVLEKDELQAEIFLKQAHWLQVQERAGAFTYPTPVPRYRANLGWRSAMAQGLAISVFVRAFNLTDERVYRDAGLQAAETLSKPIEMGGCTSFDDNGLPFLEEVAVIPPAHILNGAIFALWGLYDLEKISNTFQSFRELAVKRLIKELPRYDLGYWSRYDLMYHIPATRSYHMLHISQLKVLHELTGEPIFKLYADKWQNYLKDPLKRIRAFGKKAWFSMKEIVRYRDQGQGT